MLVLLAFLTISVVFALFALGPGRLGKVAKTSYCETFEAGIETKLQAGIVHEIPAEPEGFIVLGGGLHAFRAGDIGPGARISAALAMAQNFPLATFVYTGAGETAEIGRIFREKGITASLLLEDQATSTFENARNVRHLIGARRARPWVLITSAWHMKRALATFRAQGFDAHAYPVDFLQPGRRDRCGAATREALSVLYYWLRGRI